MRLGPDCFSRFQTVAVYLFIYFFCFLHQLFESRPPLECQNKRAASSTGSPPLFSLDADAKSPPPTFLRPHVVRDAAAVAVAAAVLHGSRGSHGDAVWLAADLLYVGMMFFWELNIYRPPKMWLQTDGKNNHYHLCRGRDSRVKRDQTLCVSDFTVS